MDVVAYLPQRLLAHLRVVLGGRHQLYPASDWNQLEDILRARAIDLAVLDPCANGLPAIESLLAVHKQFRSLRIVIYTSVRPDALHAAVEVVRHGAGQLVLFRFDDSRSKFLSLIEGQPGTALSEAVLAALRPVLLEMPQTLSAAIEDVFKHPGRYRGAKDLAVASGIGLRKLYRLHKAAGLASPWSVVAHARMLHAYAQLREGGHFFSEIERRLGYSSGRMRALMKQLFRATPRKMRSTVKPDVFVARVIAQVYPAYGQERRGRRGRRRRR